MASSITFDHKRPVAGSRFGVIIATITAHTDGSVTAVNMPHINGRLLGLSTNPGSTAPQDNYDIELIDAAGIDRLCAAGLNRDTANNEYAPIIFTSSNVNPVVHHQEDLALTVTNNNVNGATIVAEFFYEV